MSWALIKSIQKDTDLRLILPFGLDLRIGDVISVGNDGAFTLEGTCESLLGLPVGNPRQAGNGAIDLTRQFGKNTRLEFRAKGTASSLFPQLPALSAGFDLTFGSEEAWLLAYVGRVWSGLDGTNQFRQPILDAYKQGVWKADWALVNSVARVKRLTLLASQSRDTKVALSINGTFNANAALEAKLTAGISLLATSQQVTQCIVKRALTAFCTALRVQDGFFSSPHVGTLEARPDRDVKSVSDDRFWEDADAGLRAGAAL